MSDVHHASEAYHPGVMFPGARVVLSWADPLASVFVGVAVVSAVVTLGLWLSRNGPGNRSMAGSTYSGRAEGPTCRVCQKGALEILVAIKHTGVPHGLDGHQFQHHTSTLFRCERCGVGELHVCDHDCFSSYDADDRYEPWDLEWNYQLDTPDMLKLAALLRELCPAPRDPSCTCAAHAGLRSSHLSARGRDLVPISLRMKDGVPTLEPKPK